MKNILVKIDIAVDRAKNYDKKAAVSLSIGYTGNFFETEIFPKLIQAFNQTMPNVQLNLEIVNHNQAKNGLFENQYDIIFPSQDSVIDSSGIAFSLLKDGRFSCVLPNDHPLARSPVISMEDLMDQTIILFNNNQCPPAQVELQNRVKAACRDAVYYYSDSAMVSHTMVKGGIGIAIMPDFVTMANHPDFTVIPLAVSNKLAYGIAYLKNNERVEIKKFIRCAREIFAAV